MTFQQGLNFNRLGTMNIFVTSPDPIVSAYALDDKRVVKMILESAQMLCTALHCHNYHHPKLYKASYLMHPCTVWTRQNSSNFNWLVRHALALCKLYTRIYDKKHASESVIRHCQAVSHYLPNGKLTKFAYAATDDENKNPDNVFNAYKAYMCRKWSYDKRQPTWNTRKQPQWRI